MSSLPQTLRALACRDGHHGLGGATARARSPELGLHHLQPVAHGGRAAGILEYGDRVIRDGLGREVVLHEFGHDFLPRDEVRHRERVHTNEGAAEPIGQGRQPVDDHHRALSERRLHGDRARGEQRDVGRRQYAAGRILDRDDRQTVLLETGEQLVR